MQMTNDAAKPTVQDIAGMFGEQGRLNVIFEKCIHHCEQRE